MPTTVQRNLGALWLTTAVLSLSPQLAAALDCEFAMKIYKRVSDACTNGDVKACSDLPMYEPNRETCEGDGRNVSGETLEPDRTQAAEPKKSEEDEGDPLILEVQVLLAAMGYDPGVVDGRGGPATCRAADAFAAKRKVKVGCADLLGLREELKRAMSDPGQEATAGCELVDKISDQNVIDIWQERQMVLVSVFDEHLEEVEAIERAIQGDLAQLTGARAALSEVVLSTKAVSKLALGIGAVATAAAMPEAAAVLLAALAVISTAEQVDEKMREWFGREQIKTSAPDIVEIELENKAIERTMTGLIAIVEGAFEIKDVTERANLTSQTRRVLEEQIDRQKLALNRARENVMENKNYLIFLVALNEVRKTCAELGREPEVILP